MKVGAIIEARMESTRLPGKVLLHSRGIAMLERLIGRLQQCPNIDQVLVATTLNESDNQICKLVENLGVNYFRGSEEDVLSRVLLAAKRFEIETIVEVTGDCPIIDISIVNEAIQRYQQTSIDYVSNSNIRSYPDGMDVQVYATEVLQRSAAMVTSDLEREHVTLHIRKNPQLFSRIDLVAPDEFNFPKLGLTLDTLEDFKLIDRIINELEPHNQFFSLRSVLDLLESNPKLIEINSKVSRKGDS